MERLVVGCVGGVLGIPQQLMAFVGGLFPFPVNILSDVVFPVFLQDTVYGGGTGHLLCINIAQRSFTKIALFSHGI